MFSRNINVALLIFAVGLDAAILYFFTTPWVRLVLGLGLIVPIVIISSFLGLAEVLSQVEAIPYRRRRFLALRAHVDRLLAEIKRLNWLVYDQNQGIRQQATINEDIEACRAGVEQTLRKVLEVAGRADDRAESPGDPPRVPEGETAPGTDEAEAVGLGTASASRSRASPPR